MDKKNIILIMTDQHRLDFVGFSGISKLPTPNIDRLAESIAFTNCTSVNPYCTPARTALFTGKYTHQIGTLAMSGDLSLSHPTFTKALQKVGYETYGVGKLHFLQGWNWGVPRGKGHDLVKLSPEIKKFGFDYLWEAAGKQLAFRNYCDYCDYLSKKSLLEDYRTHIENCGENASIANKNRFKILPFPLPTEDYIDIVTGDKVLEFLDNTRRDKPFFMFASFCGPHPPYDAPQEYLDMVEYEEVDDFIGGEELTKATKKLLYKQRHSYKAMIKLIDDQVGKILHWLTDKGILDDTVIIFTTDHGEQMGDHGLLQKGVPYWQALTVPTAIRHPDYISRTLNNTPLENIDIAATILDIVGVDADKELSSDFPHFNNIVPAKSFMPILKSEASSIRNFAFSESYNQWQLIQTKKYKYIKYLDNTSPEELHEAFFNIDSDTDESTNLINVEELQGIIEQHRNRLAFVLDKTPATQYTWAEVII